MQTRYCECSFDVVIPKEEQDNSLKDQFAGQYRAGILAWIVQGAVAWYKDGLGIPESVRASTGARIESQDAIGQFISTYFETGDEGLMEPVANVYALYLYDAEEQGTRFPMSKRALGQKLDDRGYPSQKVGNQMYRLKLSVKEECRPLLNTDAGRRYDQYR
jgi:putative DNA primase/helicase